MITHLQRGWEAEFTNDSNSASIVRGEVQENRAGSNYAALQKGKVLLSSEH